MKVKFYRSEWYPVYSEDTIGYGGGEAEVPEDLWKKYLEARETMSDLLSELDVILR